MGCRVKVHGASRPVNNVTIVSCRLVSPSLASLHLRQFLLWCPLTPGTDYTPTAVTSCTYRVYSLFIQPQWWRPTDWQTHRETQRKNLKLCNVAIRRHVTNSVDFFMNPSLSLAMISSVKQPSKIYVLYWRINSVWKSHQKVNMVVWLLPCVWRKNISCMLSFLRGETGFVLLGTDHEMVVICEP